MEYNLDLVNVQLVRERSLISEEPILTPEKGAALVKELISHYDREVVAILTLNNNGLPINANIISIGSINTAHFDIPSILKGVLLSNATAFIVFHCHPSGEVIPSADDISLTKKLQKASEVVGLQLWDHIIVGCMTEKHYSMKEHGDIF